MHQNVQNKGIPFAKNFILLKIGSVAFTENDIPSAWQIIEKKTGEFAVS